MGFDVSNAWELTSFDYDVEGQSPQTFDIPPPAASCSEEMPSCEAEPDPIGKMHVAPPQNEHAAAITVAIEDNWGKDDYTCLYRFRVHGDAAPTT
jgi:SUN domain-containing protein 1/2